MLRNFYLCVCCILSVCPTFSQVNLTVEVTNGFSETTCDDGGVFGPPLAIEEHWRVDIGGEGWTTYPQAGSCFTDPPNTQFDNIYFCETNYPDSLSICFQAFEDDGAACIVSLSCLENICQNFGVPDPGDSYTDTLRIINDGINQSWGWVAFSVTASGSFSPPVNDTICGAIDLGVLTEGSSLGDISLSNYSNFCANNVGDPDPVWGNDQGVWFQFTTDSSPETIITINTANDPESAGDQIDLQLALYESSSGLCSGALTLINHSYSPMFFDESLNANCLKPNTTYFLLVDGENLFLPGGQEGYFGLEITGNGAVQAADDICDAENLGLIPDGGTVGTVALTQSNVCATDITDPVVFGGTNKGVWYQFKAPSTGNVTIEAVSGLLFPLGTGSIDLRLSLFSSDDDLCSGTLSLVENSYTPGLFNETFTASCLIPNRTYWLMVDGSDLNIDGVFEITIADAGIATLADSTVDVITACDSYTWIDGNTYTADEFAAMHTLTNVAGCDSVVTLNLTMKYSSTGTDVITACDSYTWIDGNTYTADEFAATHTLVNAVGCDSIVTLNLTVNHSSTGVDIITACNSYTWIDGNTYTTDEFAATHTLTNAAGCDSVVTLNLTMNYSNTGTDVITACDSYTWIDGNTYTTDEFAATHTLTNVAGCDSVVTLNLTMNYSSAGTDVITACDSYTWIDGNTYTADEFAATHTLVNAAGCDSVVTLNLTVNYSSAGTDEITACDSYTWIDGNTYTADEFAATHTLTNAAGCDSVVTLNLTINYSNTGTDVITACDSYTWIDGNTYTTDEFAATHTLTNAAGCDSVVTLNLTMNYSSTGTDAITTCDSYTWIDGNTYTADEFTATHTLTNAAGCDSIVTLNLTVNYSNTGTDVITACDSYTWIDGNTYTADEFAATHTLTNAAGCDSVVTLNLTINYSSAGTDVITACDSYTWIDGNTYTADEFATTHTLTNAVGCDSVVTLNLTMNYSNTGTDVITACDSYTWIDGNTYTADEFAATHTLINAAGCDSVVTLNLTIHESPVLSITASETTICFGETATLTASGADTHEWDSGVTNGLPFNPGVIGSIPYTVTGTTPEGCSSTETITITINDCNPVNPAFVFNGAPCIGNCLQIDDLSTGGPITDWEWTFGPGITPEESNDQHPTICLDEIGTYLVQLTTTNINGSTYTTTETLVVYEQPSVNAQLDTIIDSGGKANLVALGSLDGDYIWSPEKTIACANCPNTTANPIQDEVYTVVFTDINSCSATDTVLVWVNFIEGIGVPTAFSPNGDNHNDVLYVKGFGIEALHFSVYNRYGERVFETFDQHIGWDGNYRGRQENNGVFTWVLEYNLIDGKRGRQAGNTTLFR